MKEFLKLFTNKKNKGNSLNAFWIRSNMTVYFFKFLITKVKKTNASASFLPFGLTETHIQWTYIVHFPFILLQLRRTAYLSSSISWNFDFWPLWIRSILTQLVISFPIKKLPGGKRVEVSCQIDAKMPFKRPLGAKIMRTWRERRLLPRLPCDLRNSCVQSTVCTSG